MLRMLPAPGAQSTFTPCSTLASTAALQYSCNLQESGVAGYACASLGALWMWHLGSTLDLRLLLHIVPIILLPLQAILGNVAEEILSWMEGSFLSSDRSCTALHNPVTAHLLKMGLCWEKSCTVFHKPCVPPASEAHREPHCHCVSLQARWV